MTPEIKSVTIDGVPPMACIFCVNPRFTTCIESDLGVHLYENHRRELKGLTGRWSLNVNIKYAIAEGKRIAAEYPIRQTRQTQPDFSRIDEELKAAERGWREANPISNLFKDLKVNNA
jgi:hypothetical protein